ncbi:hypothetical protein, partial [Oscillibacter sp.]|uniref:hypothetical protein n=1 Tax=Oscillibacter sp. TaxID=1945593 RepID=UPI0028AB0A59
VELASVIATEYNVTLDWLFCRCDYRDDIDLMLNIICALDKVLKVGYKSIRNPDSNYINRELALWMDKEFREYLTEIQELQDAKQLTRQITDERYSNIRRDIQAKYKEYFYQLLGIKSCEINETRFIELETVEGADILTLLQG